MTWTNVDFPVGGRVLEVPLDALMNNFKAMADADSGAPLLSVDAYKNTTSVESFRGIAGLGSWVPAAGMYQFGLSTTAGAPFLLRTQIEVSSQWWGWQNQGGVVFADGTRVRVFNSNAAVRTVAYQYYSG
jgi:hypothetical protein